MIIAAARLVGGNNNIPGNKPAGTVPKPGREESSGNSRGQVSALVQRNNAAPLLPDVVLSFRFNHNTFGKTLVLSF